MFRPYLAIFRQLSSFWNRRAALDHKPIYLQAISLSLFTLKCARLRTKLSLRYALFFICGVHVSVTRNNTVNFRTGVVEDTLD
jgi:hypothetical protein